ncbi:hypothetical protein OHA79_52135 (plasmid) [Streptomyces sp. NBC_00841]|uniref:hypothetical protein n=1 Tax=Streptomyces sp. NBC_00841 TaxID=2975847 RepID=UPI002DD894E5|nr:hypothetical protein [Streptomyces sp. NBC_00841]WSA06032.1 hypothetical protein OHA79_52135 [Streptomyces sp. NBC_00841]
MNVTRRPAVSLATEHFDTETQELLDAIDVELPDFGDIDMDVAFGTPLEMYECLTPGELARLEATGASTKVWDEVVAEIGARQDAAEDIGATDPSITERVRERLLEALEPSIAEWIREELMGAALSVGAQMVRPIPAVSGLLPLAA